MTKRAGSLLPVSVGEVNQDVTNVVITKTIISIPQDQYISVVIAEHSLEQLQEQYLSVVKYHYQIGFLQ